ncbi:MAG: hypothetical protein ABI670_03635 [Chloroflexota bacterium]
MKYTLYAVAAILILMGVVFFLQGVNILPGSVMTGDIFWAWVGFFAIIVGGGIGYFAYRSGRRS